MNLRMACVLIVMALAVLAALLPALPDETMLVAAAHDESSGAAAAGTERRRASTRLDHIHSGNAIVARSRPAADGARGLRRWRSLRLGGKKKVAQSTYAMTLASSATGREQSPSPHRCAKPPHPEWVASFWR